MGARVITGSIPPRARACYPARVTNLSRVAALSLGLLAMSAAAADAAAPHAAKGQKKPAGARKDKGVKAAASKAPLVVARAEPPAARAPIELKLATQRVTLDNGLRVVINVDRTSPTVAIAVTYDVGSRDEEQGRSGFAHLFEHMMFQGSRNVEKGDHFRLIAGRGGVLNGTTNSDRTSYFEALPASELDLGLWLEADRMKSLDVSQANFENQRKVVQEEHRMRVSNVPYGPSHLRLEELVYQGYWPYEHSTIGLMADLDGARLEWVQAFHARHYGPNNAVLTIAGDVDPGEALAAAHRYFDAIPRVSVAPFNAAPLAEQTSQRTAVLHDDNARTPGVLYGWAVPPGRAPDHYALELAGIILGDGDSSRLHQLLVHDRGVLQAVSVGTGMRRGPSLFSVDGRLTEGAQIAEVERLIEAEIKALATRGPSSAEVEKAHRRAETRLILGLQQNVARARRLGEFELYFGDARLLEGELPRYLAVTRDDIKRAVAQHLGPTRRTLVETFPVGYAVPTPTPPQGGARKGDARKGAGSEAPPPPSAVAPAKKKGPDAPKPRKQKKR
jgi:zinc protease